MNDFLSRQDLTFQSLREKNCPLKYLLSRNSVTKWFAAAIARLQFVTRITLRKPDPKVQWALRTRPWMVSSSWRGPFHAWAGGGEECLLGGGQVSGQSHRERGSTSVKRYKHH